jgi:hypothetical protein
MSHAQGGNAFAAAVPRGAVVSIIGVEELTVDLRLGRIAEGLVALDRAPRSGGDRGSMECDARGWRGQSKSECAAQLGRARPVDFGGG